MYAICLSLSQIDHIKRLSLYLEQILSLKYMFALCTRTGVPNLFTSPSSQIKDIKTASPQAESANPHTKNLDRYVLAKRHNLFFFVVFIRFRIRLNTELAYFNRSYENQGPLCRPLTAPLTTLCVPPGG